MARVDHGAVVKTNACYLVIGPGKGGRPTVKRATQSPPTLYAEERTIRVAFEIPDALWNRPLHTLEIPADAESILAVIAEPC